MMTNPSPIYERFGALHQCVGELHDKCKQGQETIEGLIDTFYHFHGLAAAFMQDCQEYLATEPATTELQEVVVEIDSGLRCSFAHLKAEANRLNTTILDKIIERINNPLFNTETAN